jgi:hypothetical protein
MSDYRTQEEQEHMQLMQVFASQFEMELRQFMVQSERLLIGHRYTGISECVRHRANELVTRFHDGPIAGKPNCILAMKKLNREIFLVVSLWA